jgi:hypothetical protein
LNVLNIFQHADDSRATPTGLAGFTAPVPDSLRVDRPRVGEQAEVRHHGSVVSSLIGQIGQIGQIGRMGIVLLLTAVTLVARSTRSLS